jgi:hypothetical protein
MRDISYTKIIIEKIGDDRSLKSEFTMVESVQAKKNIKLFKKRAPGYR